MKLSKENLHGARFIGKWLSLLLVYELCVLVWLVFFFSIFVLNFGPGGFATQNVA